MQLHHVFTAVEPHRQPASGPVGGRGFRWTRPVDGRGGAARGRLRRGGRYEKAGFDGVELHGAHSYVICQFLSPDLNRREDQYGGDATNRARLLREMIDGVRARRSLTSAWAFA